MILLKIENINKNLYTLKDEEDITYELVLKFLDLNVTPVVGDSISISEELLREDYEGYSTFYTFGSLDSTYGKANISLTDIDVIKLNVGNKTIFLKRLYG